MLYENKLFSLKIKVMERCKINSKLSEINAQWKKIPEWETHSFPKSGVP